MTNNNLRLPQVMAKTGLSRSSIYQRMAKGTFPKSFSIGERAVAWDEDEINQVIESWKSARK